MKRIDHYKGRFKINHGLYPTRQICDYPNTIDSLRFLEHRLKWWLKGACPESMKMGLAYKVEYIRKYLAKNAQFFEDESQHKVIHEKHH